MKFGNRTFSLVAVIALGAGLTAPGALRAQVIDGVVERGSRNMEVLGHVPLGPRLSIADMDMEQEMHRPYAYVARMQYGPVGPKGLDIVSIADPEKPEVLYEWRIEDQDLHQRTGGMDVKHFKWGDRYYVVQSLQFGQGGPDSDMGAVVLDVTGLPDASTVREVARIKEPDLPGGFHNIFIYKHSNMNVYLVATVSGPYAAVYDLGALVEGRGEEMVAQIPLPDQGTPNQRRGYHDFYLGYHPDTGTDRFYGGGFGGYYIYDVSDLQNPELLTQIVQVSGIRSGHTFTPTPDGNFAIAETEYQYAPLQDLRPQTRPQRRGARHPEPDRGLDGELEEPRPQSRGAMAAGVRVRLPGRARRVQHDGSDEPDDGGALRHLPGAAQRRPDAGLQRHVRGRHPERGRAHRGERHDDRILDLPDGGVPGLERRRLGHAEHLQRPGLGQWPGRRVRAQHDGSAGGLTPPLFPAACE